MPDSALTHSDPQLRTRRTVLGVAGCHGGGLELLKRIYPSVSQLGELEFFLSSFMAVERCWEAAISSSPLLKPIRPISKSISIYACPTRPQQHRLESFCWPLAEVWPRSRNHTRPG